MKPAASLSLALADLVGAPGSDFVTLVRIIGLDPHKDFRNADLSGADLRNADLRAFDFSHARFDGALIGGARFNATVSDVQRASAQIEATSSPQAPSIVILPVGRRAEVIARGFEAPDWSPTGPGEPEWRFEITRGRAIEPLPRHAHIHVTDRDDRRSLGVVDVAVVLADGPDEAKEGEKWLSSLHSPVDRKTIRLLAPALSRQEPSVLLSGAADFTDYDAIIDTALARSPFWSGNADRSVDRRIADLVLGCAMAAHADGALRNRFETRGYKKPHVVSLAFSASPKTQRFPSEWTYALGSETQGLLQPSDGKADITVLNASWWRQKPRFADVAILCIKPLNQGDPADFLLAAATAAVRSHRPELEIHRSRDERRGALSGAKAFPDVFTTVAPVAGGRQLAITAQTPTLRQIGMAAAEEVGLARYTDTRFIADFLSGENDRQVPDEIYLPPIPKIAANRGLVTRGVDSRDAIEIDADIADDLRKYAPDLAGALRRFTPSFKSRENKTFLLPTPALLAYMEDAVLPLSLRRVLEERLATKPHKPKRPKDLRTAWRPPETGHRYAIADGPTPLRMAKLKPRQVPAQSMLIIDGDEAVPILLQSSLFTAWARATASRSTSWMEARFSVTGTFETFPVVGMFEIHRPRTAPPGLFCIEPSIANLGRRWLELSDVVNTGAPRLTWSDEARWLRDELDARILNAYGVPGDGNDLDIISRLLDLVRR